MREFIRSLPQPDQRGPVAGLNAGFAWHWFFIADAWPDAELPSGRPDSNSASARFWPSEIPVAFATIDPVVSASRMRSGVIAASALRSGARRSAALPPWHCAQRASKTGIICRT